MVAFWENISKQETLTATWEVLHLCSISLEDIEKPNLQKTCNAAISNLQQIFSSKACAIERATEYRGFKKIRHIYLPTCFRDVAFA